MEWLCWIERFVRRATSKAPEMLGPKESCASNVDDALGLQGGMFQLKVFSRGQKLSLYPPPKHDTCSLQLLVDGNYNYDIAFIDTREQLNDSTKLPKVLEKMCALGIFRVRRCLRASCMFHVSSSLIGDLWSVHVHVLPQRVSEFSSPPLSAEI